MRLDERIPEPELMEGPAQAEAYSGADFSSAHDAVVELLLERWPDAPRRAATVVDLGCGPADVTARLAAALSGARILGLDAGPRMLALGRERLARLRLVDRVELRQLHLPGTPTELDGLGRFDLVVSNSLLHHLADPGTMWSAVGRLGRPAAVVHVVDLRRPSDEDEVERLVEAHAAGEPDVLVADFRSSLRAAYRPEEVSAQLADAGLAGPLSVEVVSDRHLLVHGRLPG